MNIDISTQECRDLLDILHIADVVISGHRRGEDQRTERHRALIQKLYALLSQGEGLDRLIGFNENVHKYIPTDDFEQSALAHVLLDEFGDHLFWDELIARLTVRDAAQIAGGNERLNAMSDSNRQALEGPIRQRYIEELSANGLANLAVIEHFSFGEGDLAKTSD
jgi:hypothetical protein